jgi:ATP-dependent helicase HrpA
LIPADFLRSTPYDRLTHFPRYLKAMKVRADRWKQNPLKDTERAAQIAPYAQAGNQLARGKPKASSAEGRIEMQDLNESQSSTRQSASEAFRWLVEEFRVSLFAQELGTAEPVSKVKLDRALSELSRSSPTGAGAPLNSTQAARTSGTAEPAPIRPMVNAPEKKSAPLKNLSALDRLFPR